MKARLIDVAARAGVAPNTASTILNNRSGSWASKVTRERVLKAADELQYRPSKAAQAVRLGRFNTVGLVVPDLHNPYYPVLADYMKTAFQKRKIDLVLEHTGNEFETEQLVFQTMLDRQVDGAVFYLGDSELHREYLGELAQAGLPVVAFAALTDEPLPVDSVVIDFREGFRQAIDLLVNNGHRRFAFLSALGKGQGDGNRGELFKKLLSEKGIPSEDVNFVSCEHQIGSARDAFLELINETEDRRPTALIAMNDLSAIGAMRAAKEAGLSIPDDLSVVGVDDIPLGAYLPVALTTMAQPIEAMVLEATDLLMKRILKKGKPAATQSVFSTFLKVRESVGMAPE